MYHGEGVAFDPEGILSTLPAIVNVLAGYLAGRFIRDDGTNSGTIVRLLLAGTACGVLSLWWDSVFHPQEKTKKGDHASRDTKSTPIKSSSWHIYFNILCFYIKNN